MASQSTAPRFYKSENNSGRLWEQLSLEEQAMQHEQRRIKLEKQNTCEKKRRARNLVYRQEFVESVPPERRQEIANTKKFATSEAKVFNLIKQELTHTNDYINKLQWDLHTSLGFHISSDTTNIITATDALQDAIDNVSGQTPTSWPSYPFVPTLTPLSKNKS
ncbi:hypothetical protein MMC21_000712 [Puttea exsequens]|nr:hypothetical protein [Puttea exsequens]